MEGDRFPTPRVERRRARRSAFPGAMANAEYAAYDRPMSNLTRYILRQCLHVMLFVTAVLTATVWLAQSLRLVDLIVNRGLSPEIFAYLAVLILPRFLGIVLPIGAFIAVL